MPSVPSVIGNSFGVAGEAIAIGDSLVGNGYGVIASAGANNLYVHQRGAFNWFQAMTGHPFAHYVGYEGNTINSTTNTPPTGHNVGIGSTDTYQMLIRLRRDVLSKRPNLVLIWGGRNNLTGGISGATTAAELIDMSRLCNEGGSWVWLHTIAPGNNSDGKAFTAAQEAQRQIANRILRNYAKNSSGVILIDLDRILADTSGNLALECSYDGIHIGSIGAYRIARDGYIPAYEKMTGVRKMARVIRGAYNASTNPYGNLLPNPSFTTVSGGTASGGTVGTVAGSYTINTTGTGLTTTASTPTVKDWNDEDAVAQRMLIQSTGAGADTNTVVMSVTASSGVITTGVVARSYYEVEAELIVRNASPSLIRAIYLRLTDNTSPATTYRAFSVRYDYTTTSVNAGTTIKDVFPTDEAVRILLRTNPLIVDGTTGLFPTLNIDIDGTIVGSAEVDFIGWTLRRRPFAPTLDVAGYRPTINIPIHNAANASVTITNAAVAGSMLAGTAFRGIVPIDLSSYSQIRLVGTVQVIGATGSEAIVRYAETASTTVSDYTTVGTSAVSIPISATGAFRSSWIDITEAALREVFLAIIVTGDAATSPQLSNLIIQLR